MPCFLWKIVDTYFAFMQINKKFLEGLRNSQLLFRAFVPRGCRPKWTIYYPHSIFITSLRWRPSSFSKMCRSWVCGISLSSKLGAFMSLLMAKKKRNDAVLRGQCFIESLELFFSPSLNANVTEQVILAHGPPKPARCDHVYHNQWAWVVSHSVPEVFFHPTPHPVDSSILLLLPPVLKGRAVQVSEGHLLLKHSFILHIFF